MDTCIQREIENTVNPENKDWKQESGSCRELCYEETECRVETPISPHNPASDELAAKLDLVETDKGISLYASPGGEDYIVSVDLAAGAGVDIVSGTASDTGSKSVYGGPNPDFKRMSAREALGAERAKYAGAVAVVNAEYFADLPRRSVPVAFPFKRDGVILSEGFAASQKHAGKRLSLDLGKDYARIEPFDNFDINKFKSLGGEDAVVSLSPRVNIDGRAAARIPRTYVGLADGNSEAEYSKILFFVSSASTQSHAENTLKLYGAGPVMMLDGGGSSQLLWKDRDLVKTSRKVPNFFAIVPAPAGPK